MKPTAQKSSPTRTSQALACMLVASCINGAYKIVAGNATNQQTNLIGVTYLPQSLHPFFSCKVSAGLVEEAKNATATENAAVLCLAAATWEIYAAEVQSILGANAAAPTPLIVQFDEAASLVNFFQLKQFG